MSFDAKSKKPAIFLAFANNQQGELLEELRPEQAALHSQLNKYQNNGGGIYHPGFSTGPDHLLADLNEFTGQVMIFHFSGHSDGVGLQLETTSGEDIFLHGAQLTSILAEEAKHQLKLVILNACMTKSLVNALQKIGVPAIIATEASIPDLDAKRFSIAFYRSLVNGNSLGTAFNQAQAIIEPEANINRVYASRDRMGQKNTHYSWGLYVQNENILSWKLPYHKENNTTIQNKAKDVKKEAIINHLKKRYDSRLNQKLANKQPINLERRYSTTGTSNETSDAFVNISPENIQAEIHEIFKETNGRLFILGAPGAGKTCLLLQLALKLLETDQSKIPVLLDLATWRIKSTLLEDMEISPKEIVDIGSDKISVKVFTEDKVVEGGILSWLKKILPIELGVSSNEANKLLKSNALVLLYSP